MSAAPRVSVLLPVYDGMPHLPAAAESILAQTYGDLELLLVDDGSGDGSGAWCDGLAARDGRVRVLRHAGGAHGGLVASLNLGLAEARGEFVARMDADDRSYPERVGVQVAFLDRHPAVGAVGSAVHVCDGAGGLTLWSTPLTPALLRWRLGFGIVLTHPTVTMRRVVVRAAGGYRDVAPHNEDYDLWVRLADHTDLMSLSEPLLFFNTTGTTNISSRFRESQAASTLDVQYRVVSRLCPAASREAAADLHALVQARPLAERSGVPLAARLNAAARLLVRLHGATVRTRPADAAEVTADAARLLVGLEARLRCDAGIGRLEAVCLHARWSPGLFANSVGPRARARFKL